MSDIELQVRRVITVVDEVHREGGRALETPLRVAVAAAVVHNPLAGRFVEDLEEFRAALASPLGALLAPRAADALGAPAEAFGKGALVGEAGDVEHGSVLIHTLEFGDHLRSACDAESLLPSAEKRGPAGTPIDLALKHIRDVKVRSHHQTYEFRVPDAPHADEIVILAAVASGGRPHARSGSLTAELSNAQV